MATQQVYKVGDLVELNSGGPVMTINSDVSSSGTHFDCQWFAGKKLEKGRFPVESLKPAAAKPAMPLQAPTSGDK